MCNYLAFDTVWAEGNGLQVYSNRGLSGHAEATQLWGLPEGALRWAWEEDGEECLRLSHGQQVTPDTERTRHEILRLWPSRGALTKHLIDRLWKDGKLGRGGYLYLSGCAGLTALPEGLSVGGDLYLGGCTGLTSLPEGLSVGGCLYLSGCTGLTALPEGLSVGGGLDLSGCAGLQRRQELLGVAGRIYWPNHLLEWNRA